MLKSLDRTWQPKVITISKSKDFATMTHAELFGKLREYEMDLIRMAKEEAIDKKNKGLALKTKIPSSDKSEDDNVKGSDVEKFELDCKKVQQVHQEKEELWKQNLSTKEESNGFTCFECEKANHIKSRLPHLPKEATRGREEK